MRGILKKAKETVARLEISISAEESVTWLTISSAGIFVQV